MNCRIVTTFFLFGCLSFVTLALGGTPRPLVVDLTTPSETPRADAVQGLISDNTPFVPGTYPLISGASHEFVDLFRWLYPRDARLQCPQDLPSLEATLEKARSLLVELELDQTIATLYDGYETLPCQSGQLSRDAIRKIFYYEGIARFYGGESEASLSAFLNALAVDPSSQPLEGFSPETVAAYEEAVQQLPGIVAVRLDIDPGLRQAGLRIDGQALPEVDEFINLLPGRHVAQVFNEDGLARTATFTIEQDDGRPMKELIHIMPPGSTSYLKALFRTSMQNREIDRAQQHALDAYAKLRNHPFIMFALVSIDTPGGQDLLTYIPGKGLLEGVPPGLAPLPPMKDESAADEKKPKRGWFARRKQKRQEEQTAAEETLATDDSGISFENQGDRTAGRQGDETSGGRGDRTSGRRGDRTSGDLDRVEEGTSVGHTKATPEYDHTLALRLEMGSLSYQQDMFADLLPSVSVRFWQGLHLNAGLYYATDLGARADTLLNIIGIRVGPEYEFPLASLWARAGVGVGFSTARVVETGEGALELLIEGTPEAWLGLDYPLSDEMRLGLSFAGGFSPGLKEPSEAHGLWRAGLSFGWTL